MDKIEGGYILLARRLLDHAIMNKPPLWIKLFCWMLLKANRKPGFRGLEIGQLKTSTGKMQDAMTHYVGYRKYRPSRKQIRVIYEGLTKGHLKGQPKVTTKGHDPIIKIEHTKSHDGILITILNFEKYQDPRNYIGPPQNKPKKPSEGPSEGPSEKLTKAQRRATLYNRQEDYKRYKRIYDIYPVMCDFVVDFIFHISDTKGRMAPSQTESLFLRSLETVVELVRIDGFEFEYVLRVIRWVPKDKFWSQNLFSLAALRKKSSNGLTKFQNIANSYEERGCILPLKTKQEENLSECQGFIDDMEKEL